MKKLKIIVLCIISVTLLCGCMKANYEMEIRSDKSMRVSLISAISDEVMNMAGEGSTGSFSTLDKEAIEEYESKGFIVDELKEDGYTGYKITKNINNIDDVSAEDNINNDISNIFEDNAQKQYYFLVKKGFFKNTYKASFKAENSEMQDMMDDYDTEGMDIDMNELKKSIESKFILYLPNKAISNNANTVSSDGNVLTWDFLDNANKTIEFEFSLINRGSTYAAMIAVGLVVLIVLIEFFSGMKKTPTPSPVNIKKSKLESNDLGEVDTDGTSMNNKIRDNFPI